VLFFAESREIRLAALDAISNENLALWSEKFVHPCVIRCWQNL